MKMISNQVSDSRDSKGKSGRGITAGSRGTELVTNGGTGEKRNKGHFNRLKDGAMTMYSENDGASDRRGNSDVGDEFPLTNTEVTPDLHQHWSNCHGTGW
jgi:hypothetical protein